MPHSDAPNISTDLLLRAYREGIFPMADSRDDPDCFWVEPKTRAIIPLESFHLSRSLRKILRRGDFRVTLNTDFAQVLQACAAPRIPPLSENAPGDGVRADTEANAESWINPTIAQASLNLHKIGHAHSVECWRDGALVGGLYGVSFDRVFCGESMFSRADNASKVALAWLVAMLRRAGFTLLDCQFMTAHLRSLGAVEISADEYRSHLAKAAEKAAEMTLSQAYENLSQCNFGPLELG